MSTWEAKAGKSQAQGKPGEYYYYYLACVCLCVFVCVSHVWIPEARATGNSEANVDAGTELISSRRAANVLND